MRGQTFSTDALAGFDTTKVLRDALAGFDTTKVLNGVLEQLDTTKVMRDALAGFDTTKVLRDALAGFDTTKVLNGVLEQLHTGDIQVLRNLGSETREDLPPDRAALNRQIGAAAAAIYVAVVLIYVLPVLIAAAGRLAADTVDMAKFGLEMAAALYERYPEVRGALHILGTIAIIKSLRQGDA